MKEQEDLDFYEVLDVNDDASLEDIKASYRRLALQLHPDKTADSDLHRRFHLVQKAWEVLSDPITRKAYDRELLRKESEGLHAEKMILGLWLRRDRPLENSTHRSDSDFDYDAGKKSWKKSCRCGEVYEVRKQAIFLFGFVILNLFCGIV